jgi:hypothetical protein
MWKLGLAIPFLGIFVSILGIGSLQCRPILAGILYFTKKTPVKFIFVGGSWN